MYFGKKKRCADEGTGAPNSELLALSAGGLSCSLEQVRRRGGEGAALGERAFGDGPCHPFSHPLGDIP